MAESGETLAGAQLAGTGEISELAPSAGSARCFHESFSGPGLIQPSGIAQKTPSSEYFAESVRVSAYCSGNPASCEEERVSSKACAGAWARAEARPGIGAAAPPLPCKS